MTLVGHCLSIVGQKSMEYLLTKDQLDCRAVTLSPTWPVNLLFSEEKIVLFYLSDNFL